MKRKLTIILVIALLCSLTISASATTPPHNLTFVAADKYCMEKPLSEIPSTFEATIYIPEDFPANERPGTIIGNYAGIAGCVNLEVHQNGRFRYYAIDSENHIFDYVFTQTDLRTGQWTHIALTRDIEHDILALYINGELAQTVKTTELESSLNDSSLVVGGDRRTGNSVFFRGKIQNIAMYSDIRTADEIRADMTQFGKDDLVAGYDFSSPSDGTYNDLSANDNDLKLNRTWVTEAPVINDYDYAIAFVPDTQVVTYYYPDYLPGIYDWIVENAEEKKIQFVVGLGDITERSTDDEFIRAKEQISKMNGVVRYSLVRGNHDTYKKFCQYFPYAEMENMGGCYDYMPTNTWQEIRMGNLDYLFLSLDYGATDDVLEWADGVIAAHPNHNVIISTHCYLFRDGTTLDENDVCAPSTSGEQYNDGDEMWDKLVKKHENIVMVVCGHDPCDQIIVTQDQGEKGNTVTQMLIDAQSVDLAQKGVGMVAIAYFSNGGKTVQMEYYSTVKQQWFLDENQFTMEIDVVAPEVPPIDSPCIMPSDDEADSNDDWTLINIIVLMDILVVVSGGAIITIIIMKKRKKEV